MNDESVRVMDLKNVLDDRAYILFYNMKEEKPKEVDIPNTSSVRKNSKEITPKNLMEIEKNPKTIISQKENFTANDNKIVSEGSAKEILEKSKNHQDYMV